jgi:CBS domain-containing protein
VTDPSNRVVGIFTERDVLCRVVAEQRDPASTHVGQVMTDQVVCASDRMAVGAVQTLMKQRRIRHVPVVDGEDRLIGIISIGDVNAHFANDSQVELEYLHEYIHGRA